MLISFQISAIYFIKMGMIERRAHTRVETELVTVEIYTSGLHLATTEVVEICTVMDLSESGMRFLAEKNFLPGQTLRLTFLLPNSIVIIRTDAIVVHIQKSNNDSEVGVQFKNLGLAESKLIRHFVEKTLQSQSQSQ